MQNFVCVCARTHASVAMRV